MLKPFSLAKWGLAVLLVSSLSSCEDILEQYFPKNPNTPTFPGLGQNVPFYALSGGNKLDSYNTGNTASRTGTVAITGLGSGETLLAIDFRPATGQLYGVSSASRLYAINQNTGVARAIGAGAFTPAVSGNLVGFDFNPTVDRIRLITSTGQNLRLNPETGTVAATDGAINGAEGAMLTGAAYTNNVAGATSTALYAINTQNQQLYLVNPPNDGAVVPVGSLNLKISGNGGFDIDAKTGAALGLYSVNGKATLFTVDLSTGAARPLAEYAANLNYSGIAIPTQPVAYVTEAFDDPQTRDLVNVQLLSFDPTDVSNPRSYQSRGISGIDRGDLIVGLDFRPATGQLYALTSSSRLYTFNLGTGQATLVATLSIPLERGSYGFDFNPVADRIRIVSSTGQNLRVNPVDGVAIADGRINPSDVSVRGAAYDNNFAGATTTSLYTSGRTSTNISTLYLQNPPNAGTLVAINPLRTNINHLDIGGTTNMAYGLEGSFTTTVYSINLTTGAQTPLRQLTGQEFTGFAVGLGF
ncbi:DUF4394 domain-containing protein [Hymenobacter sp. BT188]|uniref:DUF4394 domain-containing protein n=1 Tax=Hymenobacter sp. BT188 TaxID=2763504 RepID=UPI0016519200|nr:DUF4394 domain-containing protein [Hymenobacter sp. BT188]MBC6607958.1 DUF4394 domain-containing protein [Hymenobacter sp. BT188]